MLNFRWIAKETAEIMTQNNWRNESRNAYEHAILIQTEIAEAMKDHRDGRLPTEIWYVKTDEKGVEHIYDNQNVRPDTSWKPCGIPSKLADTLIRIANTIDLEGHHTSMIQDIEFLHTHMKANPGKESKHDVMRGESIGTSLGKISGLVAIAMMDYTNEAKKPSFGYARAWVNVERLATFQGIKLANMIAAKNANNRQRGERHGGKVI